MTAVADKAERLLSEQRVSRLHSARTYLVIGDHGTYLVTIHAAGVYCPCPATTPTCSHAVAASTMASSERAAI